MTLKNRVALVTGGTQGIGKAIVRRLLDEGAKVAFCARTERDVRAAEAEYSALGREVLGCRADVSDERQVEQFVRATIARFGRLDVAVNNAGVYGPIGPAWEVSVSEWQQALDINLLGPFTVCRHVVPLMIAAGGGKIINLSGGGAASPFPRYSAYAVSKAGLVRFTETLAAELGEHNIQVNAVSPGFVATRLHQQTLEAGERAGTSFLRTTQEHVASGGVDPAKTAALVAFLASDAGNGITGKFIHAVWDEWASFVDHLGDISGSDLYTLRRIVPNDRGLTWK